MNKYWISIRDKVGAPLFRADVVAETALAACNAALLTCAKTHGKQKISHLSLWCEERGEKAESGKQKAESAGEGLRLV